jgi:hypothetical protein
MHPDLTAFYRSYALPVMKEIYSRDKMKMPCSSDRCVHTLGSPSQSAGLCSETKRVNNPRAVPRQQTLPFQVLLGASRWQGSV